MQAASVTTCRFCSFLNAAGQSDIFASQWLAASSYSALVSVGALVPGWSLVCPVRHDTNLSASGHFTDRDFWSFVARAHDTIERAYGPCAVFEHGAQRSGSLTGCGTDHSHLHLVPLGFSLTEAAHAFDPLMRWQECRAADLASTVKGKEYLFVSDEFNGEETSGHVCMPEVPVSQFFRRVIAGKLGMGEFYDYKKHPMLEIAESSASKLRANAELLTKV